MATRRSIEWDVEMFGFDIVDSMRHILVLMAYY